MIKQEKRDYISIFFVSLAIFGAILNASQYLLPSFLIWSVTNVAFAVIAYKRGFKEQIPLWVVYGIISIWGIVNALKIIG
jgi:hypothetical protein